MSVLLSLHCKGFLIVIICIEICGSDCCINRLD